MPKRSSNGREAAVSTRFKFLTFVLLAVAGMVLVIWWLVSQAPAHYQAFKARYGLETQAQVHAERKHNPSAWPHRIAIASLGCVGLGIAVYLTLFQIGATAFVWDPFFGRGSEAVVTSGISKTLPIPDAALGAVYYLSDVILALVGGTDRYEKRPWLPLLMGLAVAVSVLVSVTLVVLQPTVVHAWCTLCLLSAGISFTLAVLAWDETMASFSAILRSLGLEM